MLQPEENRLLTSVGPGTPCGNYMRRFWHPIAVSDEVNAEDPLKIRILGEDMVLFRDGSGEIGLLGLHCSHRCASLEFGDIEEKGLRCKYHGWLYDRHGRCLEQPTEPATSTFKDRIKHPAFPIQEVAGLVFTYLGLDDPPPLPRYEAMTREDGFRYVYSMYTNPANFLQIVENGSCDAFHVPFLHGKKVDRYIYREGREMHWFRETDYGLASLTLRKPIKEGDRSVYAHITSSVMPHLTKITLRPLRNMEGHEYSMPPIELMVWHTPVDDYNTMAFELLFIPGKDYDKAKLDKYIEGVAMTKFYKKSWPPQRDERGRYLLESVPEQDQAMVISQGPVSPRHKEMLVTSDKGVIMVRKVLREGIEAVQRKQDPKELTRHNEQIVIPSMDEWIDVGGTDEIGTIMEGIGARWMSTGRIEYTKD
ncbi:MAG: Rieske 2Fe-2S domain-containing protein [Nitrososphaerales archaeon]